MSLVSVDTMYWTEPTGMFLHASGSHGMNSSVCSFYEFFWFHCRHLALWAYWIYRPPSFLCMDSSANDRYLSFINRYLSFINCYLSFSNRYLSASNRYLSFVNRCLSLSIVIFHLPIVIFHLSIVIFHFLQLKLTMCEDGLAVFFGCMNACHHGWLHN